MFPELADSWNLLSLTLISAEQGTGTSRGGSASVPFQTGALTKVNRCISEGRRRFLDRVAGIESGAECERLAPVLSRLVDGEATAEDMSALRPHLRSCIACRAALRDYRAAPARVAAFAPLLIAPGLLHRVQRALAHLGLQKTAAVVAVAGALVGGGAVVLHRGTPPPAAPVPHRPHPVAHVAHAAPRFVSVSKKKQLRVKRHHRAHRAHSAKHVTAPAPAPAPRSSPAPVPTPTPPSPTPTPDTGPPAPTPDTGHPAAGSTAEFGP